MPLPERELNARERALFVREALTEYPGARGMEEFITAVDEEGVYEQARKLHERIGSQSEPDQRAEAQRLYGRSGAGGIGSGVPYVDSGDRAQADQRRMYKFGEKFNEAPRDAYGQRMGITPHETEQYVKDRFTEHVTSRIAHWAMQTRSDYASRAGR